MRSWWGENSQLAIEPLENRCLLSAGCFLQGTAFVDSSGTGLLTQKDTYLPGATVTLYQGNGTGTLLATTTTNSNGQYLFNDSNVLSSYGSSGLNPGAYTLVETPPLGYANSTIVPSTSQVLSQLNPATYSSPSTVQVDLVNPSVYIGYDLNQFYNLDRWDNTEQTFNFTGAVATNGSKIVTLANTSPMAVGDTVTITGSTTLKSTITAISPNVSITLANNWIGSTGTATVDDTTGESAGQIPVAPISTSAPYFKTITSAGVANDSSTVTMNTSGLGLAPGQFVYITNGSASLYSMITAVSSGSISIADQWAGVASSSATVNVLSDLNSTNNSPPSNSYPALQDGQFYSLCWDLQNFFDDSTASPVSYTNIFPVTPTSGQGTPQDAGQIAYLYNHYGTVNIASAAADNAVLAQANATVPVLPMGTIAEAVGLQVAVWELEYGASYTNFAVIASYYSGLTTAQNTAPSIRGSISIWLIPLAKVKRQPSCRQTARFSRTAIKVYWPPGATTLATKAARRLPRRPSRRPAVRWGRRS